MPLSKRESTKRARLVKEAVKELSGRLHLVGWQFELQMLNESIDDGHGDGKTIAEVASLGPYKQATIRFALPDLPPADIKEAVLHELVHCLTQPLRAKALGRARSRHYQEAVSDIDETLVTHVSRVLLELGI